MKELVFKPGERALAIVAHPDDETIWMGGFILKQPRLKWTIFSVCRASDLDRAPKFLRVCERYGARALIADLEDEGKMGIAATVPVIKDLIRKNIDQDAFGYVFTHGPNGEYGHPRHKGVSRAVREMAKSGEIKAKRLLLFHYVKKEDREFSPLIAGEKPDLILELTEEEMAVKKGIMSEIYGFAPDGVDTSYCTNPESFVVL
jgi:LmbE family N-acetylglucosaminyl deacetylase